MRLPTMALALSTLCLTACGEHPRGIPVAPDLALAGADRCPDTFPAAPTLEPLAPFTLPDGRRVVLLETAIARDTVVARYVIEGRQAWHDCQSPVAWIRDWEKAMPATR